MKTTALYGGRLELPAVTVVQFEKYKVVVENIQSRFRLETLPPSCFDDDMVRRGVAYILGKKRQQSVSFPSTWWEAVKQRFAPKWFLKRWPVRLTTWTVDAWALFPELEPARARYTEISFCEAPKLERL